MFVQHEDFFCEMTSWMCIHILCCNAKCSYYSHSNWKEEFFYCAFTENCVWYGFTEEETQTRYPCREHDHLQISQGL